MNRNPETLEKIDLYLSGQMEPGEETAFKQLVEKNAEIAELIEEKKITDLFIIASRLSDVKLLMDKDFKEGMVRNSGQNTNFKWWITGFCILLTTSAILYFTFTPSDKITVEPDLSDITSQENLPEVLKSKESTDIVLPKKENKIYQKEKRIYEKDKQLDHKAFADTINLVLELDSNIGVLEKQTSILPDTKMISLPEQSTPLVEKNDSTGLIPENISILPPQPENTQTDDSENNFSFKPEYREVFNIPVYTEFEGFIKIFDRVGNIVYTRKIFNNQVNTWDGTNSRGGISPPGLYIYIIEYPDGHKKTGQIVIY
jgi:hypothetical protein